MKIKKENLLVFICLLISAFCIISVSIGTGYTYLCEDDYAYEDAVKDVIDKFDDNTLKAAIYNTYRMALTEQGSHLGNFLLQYLTAYTRWGITGFHISMFFFVALTALSLFSLSRTFSEGRKDFLCFLMAVLCLCVFQMPGTGNMRELFFWYTGALNYTLELAFTLLAVSFTVRASSCKTEKNVNLYIAAASVFGFFSCLGTLEVAFFTYGAFLILTVFLWNAAPKKVIFIPFISSILGGLLDVISPGNYARTVTELAEGHTTLFDAVRDDFVLTFRQFSVVFSSPVFLAFLLIAFAISLVFEFKILKGDINHLRLIFSFLSVFIVALITVFPVAYGQHTDSFKAMRTEAVFQAVLRFMILFFVLCLSQYIQAFYAKMLSKISVAVIAITLVFCIVSGKKFISDVEDGFAHMVMADFLEGNLQNTYIARIYILSSMELAENGSDLYLTVRGSIDNQSMYGMGLSEDPNDPVNVSCAKLFDLNSVSISYD